MKVFDKSFKKCFIREFQILNNSVNLKRSMFFKKKKTRRLCLYTSRARAVISLTRSSRHKFREFQRLGLLFGIKKHSW